MEILLKATTPAWFLQTGANAPNGHRRCSKARILVQMAGFDNGHCTILKCGHWVFAAPWSGTAKGSDTSYCGPPGLKIAHV